MFPFHPAGVCPTLKKIKKKIINLRVHHIDMMVVWSIPRKYQRTNMRKNHHHPLGWTMMMMTDHTRVLPSFLHANNGSSFLFFAFSRRWMDHSIFLFHPPPPLILGSFSLPDETRILNSRQKVENRSVYNNDSYAHNCIPFIWARILETRPIPFHSRIASIVRATNRSEKPLTMKSFLARTRDKVYTASI